MAAADSRAAPPAVAVACAYDRKRIEQVFVFYERL
jgi:hypothetical protein